MFLLYLKQLVVVVYFGIIAISDCSRHFHENAIEESAKERTLRKWKLKSKKEKSNGLQVYSKHQTYILKWRIKCIACNMPTRVGNLLHSLHLFIGCQQTLHGDSSKRQLSSRQQPLLHAPVIYCNSSQVFLVVLFCFAAVEAIMIVAVATVVVILTVFRYREKPNSQRVK